MNVTRHIMNGCCGKKTTIFKISQTVTKELMNLFISLGYLENHTFTKAGIFYIYNSDLIITGPFGSDRLQIKCKVPNCDQKLNELEASLLQLS